MWCHSYIFQVDQSYEGSKGKCQVNYIKLDTLFWSLIKGKIDGSYKPGSHCLERVNEVKRESGVDFHSLRHGDLGVSSFSQDSIIGWL